MSSNNVTRFLESRKIPFTSFELPAEKLGALGSADLLGIDPQLVYKTIVLKREKPGKAILALVPGTCEVNLKKVAVAINEKKVLLTTQKEAESLTGLQAGGISPLALINHGFQVVVDSKSQTLDWMHVSGGQRGLNIRLKPQDLILLTRAIQADISD